MAGQRHTGRPATAYDYDDAGRAVRQLTEGGQGLDYHFDYQPDKTLVTWSDGRKRTYHTEGEGGLKRVVRTDHPDGSSEQRKYDASGRLTATTDPLGRKTTYAPDVVSGAVSSIKGPDGKETRFDYNRQGQLTATLYPDGSVTRNDYDDLGRITAQTAADGSITRYRYAGVTDDLPVEIEDASGGRKQLQWDRYGQLISYTDCSGYKTTYTYDPWGNLTEIRGEEGSHLTHEYDARGNLRLSNPRSGRLYCSVPAAEKIRELAQDKRVGVLPGREGFPVLLQCTQRQFGINARGLMGFCCGDHFPLGIDDPTVSSIMMAVTVRTDAVAPGNICLIFDSARRQQCLPVQRAGSWPVGDIQRQIVIIQIA
ncbi:TPA: RHS repeat protein [Citrobacter farmeri]|nr:RHS repeat protein [Citrobacter farmeri]HCA0088249.1 RHS repeat protein [Citrobacter farmeri]HCA1885484.1 RHS repeat protein [Citrobacter farmeri]HCA2993851.1 RHS repeat protein [Citrobacter farmeri]